MLTIAYMQGYSLIFLAMPTQRLLLLGLLVVVAGGCSMWYTQKILPKQMPAEDIVMDTTVTPSEPAATTDAPRSTKETKPSAAITPAAPAANTAAAAGSVDAAIDAISASADADYNDSSLDAQFTNDAASSVTNAYAL